MNLLNLWQSARGSAQGKKTYLTVALLGVALLGARLHWWTLPADISEGLIGLALVFLRCGMARVKASAQAQEDSKTQMGTQGTASLPPH